jgi:hypothetical protein
MLLMRSSQPSSIGSMMLLSILCFYIRSLLLYYAPLISLAERPLVFIESIIDGLMFLYPLNPTAESRVETMIAFGESVSRVLLSTFLSGVVIF